MCLLLFMVHDGDDDDNDTDLHYYLHGIRRNYALQAPGREFLHYNEETSLNGHEVKIVKSDRLNLDASTIFTCLRPSKKALPLSRRITNGAVMPRASEGVKFKPQALFCRGDSASQTERGYRCTLPSYLQRANGGSSDATSKGLDDAQLAEAVGTKRFLVVHSADSVNMHNSRREGYENGLRNEPGRVIFRSAVLPTTAAARGRRQGGHRAGRAKGEVTASQALEPGADHKKLPPKPAANPHGPRERAFRGDLAEHHPQYLAVRGYGDDEMV
ncbi:hypothetical protein LA080_006936 [Diaporthe eres]|nr:hypothetical protein LA080_006936 [Diaporthe eres]